MSKILLFANTDWYLYNFRLSLAEELRNQGHEVVLLSATGDYYQLLQRSGFQWLPFPLSRQGVNPFSELFTLWRLIRLYHQVRPDIVHHFTIKPVIYGSFAAHILRVPGIINSITGLGHLFIDPGFFTRFLRIIAKIMYRIILPDTRVIFENPEDERTFVEQGLLQAEQSHLILGTGVDTERFRPSEKNNEIPLVLFSSRILVTKGLPEYVEAASILKQKGLKARFVVAGTTDPGNPASISTEQINAWKDTDVVELWGWQNDMPSILAQADIFCLPSYREGIPNALLEACAAGLPIVATDVPGCRDVVTSGMNGLLVPVRKPQALADALETLILDRQVRLSMGTAARQIAIQFNTKKVNAETLMVYRSFPVFQKK
jgi:glycosyltransferase involved in cell wall biosynthesis